jgi:hypothetical protein
VSISLALALSVVVAPTAAEPAALSAPAGAVLYMNRHGGVFTPGSEDSRHDRSGIIGDVAVIAPWDVSDEDWAHVMTCVRGQFAPFAIEVTDVDPGDAPHVQSVVGGTAADLGFGPTIGGIAPFRSDCAVIRNPIVFTFAAALPDDPQVVCEVVAQEVGHSFGLDHEYLCEDPMSYLGGCGAKSFQDVDAACGEGEPRPCRVEGHYDCHRETQNSYQLLAERLGLRGEAPEPPALSLASPVDGAVVSPGFTVRVDASSVRGAVEVELRLDGVTVGLDHGEPFEIAAPADLEPGAHIVEVIARDGLAETSTSIAVEIGGPGAGDDPTSADDGDADAGPGTVPGCAAGGPGNAPGALLLLLVLVRILASARGRAGARR